MRTPIYIADKKRSKYAYQALLNLEKAIVMANAYADNNYHTEQPRSGKHLSLKSSIKKSKEDKTPKKKVRIQDENEGFEEYAKSPENDEQQEQSFDENREENSPEDHKTLEPSPDDLQKRQSQLEKLQKIISLRESLKNSLSNPSISNIDNDELLLQILEREKEEIKKVEEQLRISQIEKDKQNEISRKGQIDKARRWNVIDQKRDNKKKSRQEALNRDIDPFKEAQKLVDQESKDKEFQELELSEPTDDDVREQKMKDKEDQGKFLTFKRFLQGKKQTESATSDDVVRIRESKPEIEEVEIEPIEEKPAEEDEKSIESDITDELDFSNQNRSFDKHPLEISHDSKLSDNSIRMSRTTLRQIRDPKRSKSQGPIGRGLAYFNARSMAETGVSKIGGFLKMLRNYITNNYTYLKDWLTSEKAEQKKRKAKSVPRKAQITLEKSKSAKSTEIKIEEEKVTSVQMTRKSMPVREKPVDPMVAAKEFLFHDDTSSIGSEEPSAILKRKIEKLKQDELRLKEMEKQLELDMYAQLKSKKADRNNQVYKESTDEANDQPKRSKKGKKKKKKKQNKVHHDMQRMKQEHIKRILQKDSETETEEPPKEKLFVKEFRSDKDSVASPIRQSDLKQVKQKLENLPKTVVLASPKNAVIAEPQNPAVFDQQKGQKEFSIKAPNIPKRKETPPKIVKDVALEVNIEEVVNEDLKGVTNQPNLKNEEIQVNDLLVPSVVSSKPQPHSPKAERKNSFDVRDRAGSIKVKKTMPRISQELRVQAIKNNILGLRDFSDNQSALSENKRYNSVERPRLQLDVVSLPALNRHYSGSKYSLRDQSEKISSPESEILGLEPQPQMPEVSSEEERVPDFELKNTDLDKKTSESEIQFDAAQEDKEESKYKPEVSFEVRQDQQEQEESEIEGEEGKFEYTESPQDIMKELDRLELKDDPKLQLLKRDTNNTQTNSVKTAKFNDPEVKDYDDIIKESLDFATFLKNQAQEIANIRDSDPTNFIRIQKHVENLLNSPKKSHNQSKAKQPLRQTLDFILSDSDESLGEPDPQEIKESIIAFERRSLTQQSEGLLKNMRDAINKARL